jgi:copper(I)-binding protein
MQSIIRPSSVVLSALLLVSCAGGGGSDVPEILVEEGWARAMPLLEVSGAGTNSAVYLLLRNDGDEPDRLTGAVTDAAGAVEIHESLVEDDVMRMRRVDGVEVPSRGTAELKPGGVHLMLLGLTRSLVEGEKILLTLHFQRSGDRVLTIPVRALGGG